MKELEDKSKNNIRKISEINGKVSDMGDAIIGLEERMDELEKKFGEFETQDEFIWNGHENADGNNVNGNAQQDGEGNPEEVCDVMVSDPFLHSTGHLVPYDGNPSVSFTRWVQKFKDLLSLCTTQLNEDQKINRLRVCLTGPARAELDSMDLPPVTLNAAINHLQSNIENDNTKSIARQALIICRQYPGEKVFILLPAWMRQCELP